MLLKIKRKYLIAFVVLDFLFLFSFVFLFYGPWSGFRTFWITTSMTTKSHQYLAKWFYSDEAINKVLNENIVVPVDEMTDTSLIKFKKYSTSIYKNKYEKEILEHEQGELYKLIEVSGKGYNGFLVAIYDPSRVYLTTTRYLGVTGEDILTVSKRERATIMINGNGFHDPNWNSNGSTPHGTVIQNGKIVSKFRKSNWGGGFIGFTPDNVLLPGNMTDDKADNKTNNTINVYICEADVNGTTYTINVMAYDNKTECDGTLFCPLYKDYIQPLIKSVEFKDSKKAPKMAELLNMSDEEFEFNREYINGIFNGTIDPSTLQ